VPGYKCPLDGWLRFVLLDVADSKNAGGRAVLYTGVTQTAETIFLLWFGAARAKCLVCSVCSIYSIMVDVLLSICSISGLCTPANYHHS